MQAKIKLNCVSVWGVDTHARAAGFKQWFLRKGAIFSSRIPIVSEVTFEAQSGDRIGVLGLNGSGKSSLLKVISGHYPIHAGTREVEGRVAPLIEMGAGFDPEMSGRENIKLAYALHGRLRAYSRHLEEQIIEFSELGDKIDLPLKTYSNGMRARLAFASAIFQQPDILLMDEIFATGDASFIEHARAFLRKQLDHVSIALMVSHDLQEMKDVCQQGIVMHQGRLVRRGPIAEMIEFYRQEIAHLAASPEAA